MSALWAFLNRHSAVVLPIAAVALAISCGAIIWRLAGTFTSPRSPPRISQAYFYDLSTGELFEAPADQLGPIETDSGPFEGRAAGVRANVFSCGSCRDPDQRYIGWLEMPEPETQATPRATGELEEEDPSREWIRRPQDDRWYASDSPEAISIMQQAASKCGNGTTPQYCHPPSALAP